MDSDNFDLLIKLALFGDANVGKTNIVSRYLYHEFDDGFSPTIGMDFL